MNRQLVLLRHAKSSWSHPERADHDRPLNARGRRQAPLVGAWLDAHDFRPDLVLCSSARRARETVEALCEAAQWDVAVRLEQDLYLAEPEGILDLAAWQGDGAVRLLMVGHNPGLSTLASRLAGREIALRTACLARFELSGPWADLTGPQAISARLLDLVCPGHGTERDP